MCLFDGHQSHVMMVTTLSILLYSPTPRVEWQRDSGGIPPLRSNLESFGMELVISDLRYEDEGVYDCIANNDYSERPVTRTFSLTVMCELFSPLLITLFLSSMAFGMIKERLLVSKIRVGGDITLQWPHEDTISDHRPVCLCIMYD